MEWHLLATALLPQWAMLSLIQHIPLTNEHELLFQGSITMITLVTVIVLIYHQYYAQQRTRNQCLSDCEVCTCCTENTLHHD